MANSRQTRRPVGRQGPGQQRQTESGAGLGVDVFGGPVIDPTENVLALVDAESRFQNAMRDAESRFQNAMREAETRRINDLRAQKEVYERRATDTLQLQVESNATLLSGQLDRMTTILAERISKLEQFRWETGGKTSVYDPALEEALKVVQGLKVAEGKTEGRGIGRDAVIAYIFALAGIGVAIAAIVT